MFVIANNLGLDLVNTRIVDNGAVVDLLNGFDDLLEWSVAVGLLDKGQAEKAGKKWSGSTEAAELFKNAQELRDSIRHVAVDLSQGKPVSTHSLDELNDMLKRKSGFFEIIHTEEGYEKRFHSETNDIRDLLVPVAENIADLLCFGDLTQVRKCEGETCVLYFYDTSRNHRRRWCSMAACGNRAKASAFYERHKALQNH
jgi:predicted RNA-binding Zn ribbon-like protein